jgi:hypothetical protein
MKKLLLLTAFGSIASTSTTVIHEGRQSKIFVAQKMYCPGI